MVSSGSPAEETHWPCKENPDALPLLASSYRQKADPSELSIASDRPLSTPDESSSTTGEFSATSSTSFSWSQWRLLVFLSVGNLLDGCCSGIQIPFYSHEASIHGLSSVASSTVFSCFSLSQLLAIPLMGWLGPRIGVTRLYMLGLLLTGLTTVAFGQLTYVEQPTPFLAACLTVRSAEAVGAAATLTARRTLIINQFPQRVNSAMSIEEAMTGAGLFLGPVLGSGIYTLGGYGAPFYTLGALLLATAAAGPLVMPEETNDTINKTDDGDDGQKYSHKLCLVLSTPDNWLIFITLLVAAMNWTAMDPSMEPYVRRTLGMGPAELGLFLSGSLVGYALSSPVWGRLSDAVDNTFLLVAGCLAPTALGVLLIPPSPLLGLAPSRLLFGLGTVLRETFQLGAYLPLLALMVRLSTARGLESGVRGQALVSAVFSTVFSLGEVLGPVGGGLVADQFGYPTLATCMGAVTAAVCLAMAVRGLVYHTPTAGGSVK